MQKNNLIKSLAVAAFVCLAGAAGVSFAAIQGSGSASGGGSSFSFQSGVRNTSTNDYLTYEKMGADAWLEIEQWVWPYDYYAGYAFGGFPYVFVPIGATTSISDNDTIVPPGPGNWSVCVTTKYRVWLSGGGGINTMNSNGGCGILWE